MRLGLRSRGLRRDLTSNHPVFWVGGLALLTMAVLVGATVLVARGYAERQLDELARDRVDSSATIAAVAVRENVDRLMQSVRSLSGDDAFQAAVAERDSAAIDRMLRALQTDTEGAFLAAVTDPSARVIGIQPLDRRVLGRTFDDRDWYRGVQTQSPYLSEVFDAGAYDNPRAIAVAGLVQRAGKDVGILVIAVKASVFGQTLLQTSSLPEAPQLAISDQSRHVVTGNVSMARLVSKASAAAPPVGPARLDGSRDNGDYIAVIGIVGTGWYLSVGMSTEVALESLPGVLRTTTWFAAAALLLILILAMVVLLASRTLAAEQQRAARREQAFELNDAVVQRLATADLALSVGQTDTARAAIEAALDDGRRMIGELAAGRQTFERATHIRTGEAP